MTTESGIFESIKKNKKFLIFLFLLSFVVRGLFFGLFLSKEKRYFFYDSKAYYDVAVQITKGNGVSRTDKHPYEIWGQKDVYPNFWRVPGYSVFLAGMYKVFGVDSLAALWVQLFLASLIPLLIFMLALILFSRKLLFAKIIGVYSAFHLGFVLYAGVLMSETFFTLFFLLFATCLLSSFNFFFCKGHAKTCYKNILLAGVFLGLASLFRPVGHYLLVVSIFMLLFSKGRFAVKAKKIGILSGSWLFVVSCWLIRNYLLTGFIFFHTLPGHHFVGYSVVPIDVQLNKTEWIESYQSFWNGKIGGLIKEEEQLKDRELNEMEKCVIAEKFAFAYLAKYPYLFIKNSLNNMFRTCASLYSSDILASLGSYPDCWYKKGVSWWQLIKRFLLPPIDNNIIKVIIWFEILFHFLIWLGFGFGLLQALFNLDLLCAVLKFLPIVGLMIAITLATGFARFRVPIDAFLIILSFCFWVGLFKKKVVS